MASAAMNDVPLLYIVKLLRFLILMFIPSEYYLVCM